MVLSTPDDARGLLLSAVRDEELVIVFEHKVLYGMKGEVPDDDETLQPVRVLFRRERGTA